ncbi:MAG: nucleoside triphosphate pyrophosphohydrolase [Clostridia bacterium]|nr:nucleoside triphosphate pyrophosphohydrolase [Clostridia bacterium]
MSYQKLVRDKIPEIIKANDNVEPITRILDNDEYLVELNFKIQEELAEYLDSGDVEELADLEEVLRAILDAKNVSYEEFESIRKSKVEKRGAFKEKIYLEGVKENNL